MSLGKYETWMIYDMFIRVKNKKYILFLFYDGLGKILRVEVGGI